MPPSSSTSSTSTDSCQQPVSHIQKVWQQLHGATFANVHGRKLSRREYDTAATTRSLLSSVPNGCTGLTGRANRANRAKEEERKSETSKMSDESSLNGIQVCVRVSELALCPLCQSIHAGVCCFVLPTHPGSFSATFEVSFDRHLLRPRA